MIGSRQRDEQDVLKVQMESSYRKARPVDGFLPDFCNAHNVFLVVMTAELLALILTLGQGLGDEGFLMRFALISVFIQWIALGSVGVLCVVREGFSRLRSLTSAYLAYGVILAVTFTFSLVSAWIVQRLYLTGQETTLTSHFTLRSVLISAVVAAVMLRYFYVQHQWKSNTEAEARSRVQALQARIRPHFLFNSMNTIASLTRSDPHQAERAVEDLADLFRVSLAERNFLSLREEINVTRGYLSIEQHRLGDRLKLDWQIDDDINYAVEVPALSLQPLVENALYHGIEPLAGGGTVTISVVNQPDAIEVKVSNPTSAKGNQRHHKGNRIAQENIRQRLQLAYGDAGQLNIEATQERYTVSFKIPRIPR